MIRSRSGAPALLCRPRRRHCPAAATRYVAGASGSGDPFFPFAGNGGYDVSHYGLKIDYDPPANVLAGRTLILARATQNLKRFNLDLRPSSTVSEVTVDGRPRAARARGRARAGDHARSDKLARAGPLS